MRAKCINKIFVVMILLGMLTSPALGSHLKSSPLSSGPPQLQKPQQAQNPVSRTQKIPASLTAPRTKKKTPSLNEPTPNSTLTGKKKQPAKPHTNLGWRFLLNGQPQAAMAAYRQALRQNPRSAKAYLGLGISLKSLGKVGLAKKAFLKAVNLDSRLPSALVHLGYLYAEGHFGQSDLSTARQLFYQASQLGDPFASIALLDMKSRSKL